MLLMVCLNDQCVLRRHENIHQYNISKSVKSAKYKQIIRHLFFPGLFFYVYIASPNPKNPEGPTPQALNPSTKNPNPKPQTTINEPT